MGSRTDRLRQAVDEQTRRYAAWLMRDVPNPTHFWHGETGHRPQSIRLLRLGDCSWHVIEHGHAFGEPGYPALLDSRLRESDIALRFDDCFAGRARDIHPPTLSRVSKAKPDAIIVQMGVGYGALELLPLYRFNLIVTRLRVNRALGPFGGWLHRRLTAPLLRRFGRPMLSHCDLQEARDGFARLTSWIEQTCPGTPWAILPPNPPLLRGWADPELVAQATEIYARAAVSHGGAFLDYRAELAKVVSDLGPRAVYGATGYDLRWPGHEVIEHAIHGWLSQVGALRRETASRSSALTSEPRGEPNAQVA